MESNRTLQPVKNAGSLQGYGNLSKKENRHWWRTRKWLVQTIIWLAIVNGILAMVLWVAPQAEAQQAASEGREQAAVPVQEQRDLGLTLFFTMAAMASAVGVVIIGQDAVIQEKQTGTAAWVLSKPVSRPAFILSKITSDGLGILVTMVIIQGLVAYLQIYAATGPGVSPAGFAGGLALVFLTLLFYLTLAVMLGTLFDSRGAVLGIPMIFIFGYQFILGVAPFLVKVMPWALAIQMGDGGPSMAHALAIGQPVTDWLPAIATLGWIVLFTVVALWRFGREEF